MATLWIAFLIWVYVDPPKGDLFVFMATQWALVSVLSRQSVTTIVPGVLVAIPLGGVLYVLVMPHLSGFLELGTMLFVVTFALFYLFWQPQLRGIRSTALALVYVQLSISNQQTYDFSSFANVAAALLLSVALAIATSYVPASPRPEKAFLRLLRRFFRQAEYLLSRLALDRDQQRGWAARWKLALYSGDLLELPDKLAQLGRRIDYALLPGDTPEKVEALVANLRAITHRLKDLSEARELPHSDVLVQRFHDELRDWRQVAQEQVRLWAEDPVKSVAPGANLEERLAARMARLDAKIEEAYRDPEADALSERDYANFFRYLGGLRGLSEAGIGFIRAAQKIDWARWREARF